MRIRYWSSDVCASDLELTLRLAPRQDPHSGLYELYGQVRERLREGAPLSWTLRRFERDLLEALGFGFDLSQDGAGAAIDPAARYRLAAAHGPRRLLSERLNPDRKSGVLGRRVYLRVDL